MSCALCDERHLGHPSSEMLADMTEEGPKPTSTNPDSMRVEPGKVVRMPKGPRGCKGLSSCARPGPGEVASRLVANLEHADFH